MANPRQRRKSRSGTAKVKTSKASIKNKHKVIVKGPEVLVENWDRHKTVRQNYAKLGLLPNLNPRQAGGIEPVEAVPFAVRSATAATMADLEALGSGDEEEEEQSEEDDEDEDAPMASTSAEPAQAAPGTLAKGLGRIVRDENGKVIKIILGGDDGQEIEEEVKERVERDDDEEDDDDDESDEEEDGTQQPSPWGQPMADWSTDNIEREPEEVQGPRSTGQGIPIFGGVRRTVEAKTDVVRELEHLAASQRKVIRHTSEFEGDWLLSLVAKYGDDIDKMARDRKVNVWQKTAGEIKRMVIKAGGFAKLKAKAAQIQGESA